jgi:hypothetical protein
MEILSMIRLCYSSFYGLCNLPDLRQVTSRPGYLFSCVFADCCGYDISQLRTLAQIHDHSVTSSDRHPYPNFDLGNSSLPISRAGFRADGKWARFNSLELELQLHSCMG